MNTKVKCLECNKEFGAITSQHLKSCCGMSLKEYKEKYPDVETVSETIRNIRKKNFQAVNKLELTVYCSECGENPIERSPAIHWKYVCDECKAPETYPGKIYLPEKDLVICQICWQGMEQISWMHTRTHGLTLSEYRKMFPKAWVTNKRLIEKRREKHTGKNNPAKRAEVRKKISKSQKFKAIDYINKYPWIFPTIEKIRDNLGLIEVMCKKCGTWFHPTPIQLQERIRSLSYGADGLYMYCSDECKGECPLYRLQPLEYLKEHVGKVYTEAEYQTFRQEVLKRQKDEYGYNFCEMCGKKKKLHVHHEKPQKTHSIMSLDPDNGIVLCEHCHLKKAHIESCSLGSLANKIC
ncbi:MAG: HNH endonuclease [Vallitaleaceae bacterium]|nr:HNH endonuclease [Vallitaleaceae bacterium]